MPDVLAALEHCKFLISKGRGGEPAKLVLPRIEAQRRRANKEGRTRLIRDMHTSEAYSEWNAEFDRYIEAAGDPNIGCSIMLRLLKQLPTSSIKTLAEDTGDEDFMLGRGRELSE
jgi:hypothetical protein